MNIVAFVAILGTGRRRRVASGGYAAIRRLCRFEGGRCQVEHAALVLVLSHHSDQQLWGLGRPVRNAVSSGRRTSTAHAERTDHVPRWLNGKPNEVQIPGTKIFSPAATFRHPTPGRDKESRGPEGRPRK